VDGRRMTTKQDHLLQLIKQLKNQETRWEAMLELKLIKDTDEIRFLLRFLKDEDWSIRWIILEKIGELKDRELVSMLLEYLRDADFNVRRSAAKIMQRFGPDIIPEIAERFVSRNTHERASIFNIITGFGKDALGYLEPEAKKENWVLANQVVNCIWYIDGQEAEEILIKLLSRPMIEKTVMVALGNMKSKRAISKLMEKYDYPQCRKIVLASLVNIGEEAFNQIIKLGLQVEKNIWQVRAERIMIKLAKIMLPRLEQVLKNSSPQKALIVQKLMIKMKNVKAER
jgi:HEAT repeat protein